MPKILVAPGSGDIHWIMLKMESLIEKEFGGETPEVWVWSENRKTERSEGYVKRIPFVKWGGYFRAEKLVSAGQQVFVHGKPWILRNWDAHDGVKRDFFDLFVAFNAPLGWGTHISKLMPTWDINWKYELTVTEKDQYYGQRFRKKHGPFVLASFFGHSFYKGWLKNFGREKIDELLGRLRQDHTVVLIGREWDTFMSSFSGLNVNLVGKTSMGQLLGLCGAAKAFVGFASGAGMLAQHLNCPTFMLWDMKQWHPHFATNWVSPNKLADCTYRALDIRKPDLVDFIAERINEKSVHRYRGGAFRESVDDGPAGVIGSVGEAERPPASPG